jgi:3-dehydroquinate dehydratase/shikimate dehydrogenase
LRERGGGLVAFASGPAGSFTRVLAPIFGSPLTYAAPIALPGLPDPEPTAAGQLAVNEILSLWPPGGVTPGTAVYGVVGKSVANSLSPFVQGMALKAAHVDAVFLAFETDDLAAFLALADDENFRGFSVTAPHKCAALAVSVSSDDPSRAAGAANTLLRERTAWRAANTDVPAIADTLERAAKYADVDLRGAPALVIGTGGAARAATLALTRAGAQVTVAGRREDAARDLAAQLGCEAMAFDPEKARNFACIVHTTPVGTQAPTSGDQSSGSDHDSLLRSVHISPGTLVLDAVYRPIRTPLLMAAKEAGAVSIPGAEWFVRQAALQFQLFTGQEPDEDLMRSAFEGALEQASAAGGTLARGV